jgi:hypothetical protein
VTEINLTASSSAKAIASYSGRVSPYIYGTVEYADDLGTVMRMGFARLFNNKSGRFTMADDPDYEYAD